MMKYIQEITATVVRKGVVPVGFQLGQTGGVGKLAYGLAIQRAGEAKTETIYLDYRRSKDFYRIPVGEPLLLKIGRLEAQAGRWLDSWNSAG